jgi:predicted RecB family nuclease
VRIIGGRLRLSASDVANFLACQHLTRLDLLAARGELRPPHEFDVGFADLVARGEAHEREVLDRFRADGHDVTEIAKAPDDEMAAATLEAIRSGADVIYQGVLTGGPVLFGRPDFLLRAGGTHYEVVDAKLARSAKARAIAQIAFYSHLLAEAQGVRPRRMHLALGNGEFASYKVEDYAAYERQTRRVLAAFIAADQGQNPPSDPYPDPVEHCAICRWSEFCATRRRRDDDTADLDASGTPRYTQIWSFDRQGEKRAFQELIDFITLRRERNPGLHVYHYNHYEPTAVDHLTELH